MTDTVRLEKILLMEPDSIPNSDCTTSHRRIELSVISRCCGCSVMSSVVDCALVTASGRRINLDATSGANRPNVQLTDDVSLIQCYDQLEHVPFVLQRQVSIMHTVRSTVNHPEVQSLGRVADMPAGAQRQTPVFEKEREIVESFQVQFKDDVRVQCRGARAGACRRQSGLCWSLDSA